MKLPIYLDCNAATPVDDRVFEAMRPYFTEIFGNAASTGHAFGAQARAAVDDSRRAIAEALNVSPEEIVFTSGATESDNLAIKGIAKLHERGHIITAATEHKAVLDPCRCLAQDGYRVTCLPVDRQGFINLDELSAAFSPDTILVSIMHGNNEIGTVQDIAAIGALCRARGVPFHTDATQTIGKLPFDAQALNVDMASLTAHKMYGPKGVGALFVRRRGPASALAPLLHGGGHERGLRSGTLDVPAIVGFGAAAALCASGMVEESARLGALRDRLLAGLRDRLGVVINGSLEARLPHNLNVTFADVDGGALLMAMTDIAVSSGAACSSASAEPSHVLRAIGRSEAEAKASLRFGLGRFTTAEEVDFTLDRVTAIVTDLRSWRRGQVG